MTADTEPRSDDYGTCKTCGHDVRSHGRRSGLCGADGCHCGVFDGPGIQPWEVSPFGGVEVRP